MGKNNLVAVYGTLRKDQGNWKWALSDSETAEMLGEERIKGFGMVSLGGFPAVYTDTENEEGIQSEIYAVNDNVFYSLDRLEGYPHFYNRKEIDTQYGKAWIYFIDSYSKESSNQIEDGDWIKFKTK